MSGPAKSALGRSKSATSSKVKLTDEERHKRFLEEARRAEASDDPKDFDKALSAVARSKPKPGSKD
jgi:hypothetical protein